MAESNVDIEEIFDRSSFCWKQDAYYNQVFVEAQIQWFEHKFQTQGYLFVNEVLDALGLKRTNLGQLYGWSKAQDDKNVDIHYETGVNAEIHLFLKAKFIADDIDKLEAK